jgi:hypothetical protein
MVGQAGRRLARFGLPAAALALVVTLAPKWPAPQTVHYVLGSGAARVEEIDARWGTADGRGEPEDWTHDASFRYAAGRAPRVVTHQPRLPDGDYRVQIEIVSDRDRRVVERRVTLGGGVTSIDLVTAVPR